MKRYIVFSFLFFYSVVSSGQSSVYQQQIVNKDGNNISISSFAGKKILIASCSAFTPELARLNVLNKLSKDSSAHLQIIIIPLLDIDSPASKLSVHSALLDTAKFSFIVCMPVNGKKINAVSQAPLLRWLTNKSGNIHLDNDLQNSNQMFVVGENGILYAELFGVDDMSNGNLTTVLKSKPPAN